MLKKSAEQKFRLDFFSAENFSAEKKFERKFLFGAFFQNFTQAWAPILRWEMDLGLNNFSTNYFGCSSKFAWSTFVLKFFDEKKTTINLAGGAEPPQTPPRQAGGAKPPQTPPRQAGGALPPQTPLLK